MKLYFPMCIVLVSTLLICGEYLPLLEVSGEFSANKAFH